ncbi:hypothetical protein L1N85_05345 [Paenibacillus alkaliterrae]|uniref:hypothetical protein n=1 Tax=Paenibacillus alkaliterrae TaxID=320909 RepID=UPI001F488010|nr:hypothetical protein [Paenibacillus alkaliterrae]MCF2937850.1 hypothetical protein [Paenibacillus alkaliterrae]
MTEKMMELLAEKYDLTVNERENVVYSCPAEELLNESRLKHLLELYTPMVKGKEQSVGEVYMTSWFRGPMLGLIYMLSKWNKSLDLSLSNLTVQIYTTVYNNKPYYRCGLLIHQYELEEGPEEPEANESWTKEKLSRFFEYTVRPVLETIAKVGILRIGMLWSQLPASLEYGHELMMKSEESELAKRQAERNYKLIKSLEGERFGRNKNPLDVKFRMIESMDNPDKQVCMKYACCLYYLVEDGYYCYTCPRLKESEREERRTECRAVKQA